MADPAPDQVRSLTYVSTATSLLTVAELVDLLEQIRPRNMQRGITGMLLYSGGNIIQVLEGAATEVEALFASIQGDSRHRDVTVLQHKDVPDRAFADWAMGFRNVSEREVRDVLTLAEFVRRPVGDGLGDRAESTYELLSHFRAHTEHGPSVGP